MSEVHVHLLPKLFEPGELAGGVAVMIDVLRASSTICTALANGAAAVRPFASVDETRTFAAEHGCLTGGERGGVPIDGFSFGNSPSSYAAEAVAGREICFTTTNGTQALTRMSEADEVLIGCFLNRSALVERLRSQARPVHLVCAGTDGAMTSEDVLLAGAVAGDLLEALDVDTPIGTQLAVSLYRRHSEEAGGVEQAVRAGQGGRNLKRLGLEADIADVLVESSLDVVPRLDEGRLVSL